MKLPAIEILIADGNAQAARIAEAALESDGIGRVRIVPDGNAALNALDAGVSIPDLIILDLGAPLSGGLDIVSRLKSDSRFRHIPLIVWVSPDDRNTAVQAYERHANCVVSKPADAEELTRLAYSIAGFWLHCALLPRRGHGMAEAAARGNAVL